MFIIYPVALGIIIGYLTGGRLGNLLHRSFRWKLLVFAAIIIQLVIFSDLPVLQYLTKQSIEILHYFSYVLILVFVIKNVRIPGILFIGLGIFLNALVIFLNGGYMPTNPENMENTAISGLAAIIRQGGTSNNSSLISSDTLLPWLGDIFYLPKYIPFSNVFSAGDLLIGTGVFIYLLMNMRPVKRWQKAGNYIHIGPKL